MSRPGDCLVRCCNRLDRLPSFLLCFLIILLQDVVVDYYLIEHLTINHLFWSAPDLIVLILVIVCFRMTSASHFDAESNIDHSKTYVLVWVTWVFMQAILAAKVVVICTTFATDLDEENFFGPTTLKTAIALGSCIYVLLLTSQHDAPPSSERRRYIEELTGTVVFDLLDTADILDVLFDADDRPGLGSGLPEFIIFVAVLNLLLPTVPLLTLSKTKFGMEKLSKRMVYMHRLLLVLVVNVPNLICRMALWHGFSVGISPFTLKNIILIVMTAYEFYEHKKEKFEMHEEEKERDMEEFGDRNGNGKLESNKEHRGDNKDGGSHGHRHSKGSAYDDEIHFDIENRMVTDI